MKEQKLKMRIAKDLMKSYKKVEQRPEREWKKGFVKRHKYINKISKESESKFRDFYEDSEYY